MPRTPKRGATKMDNTRMKHSATAYTRTEKRGGTGKGGWGNPMDDVRFLDAVDPVSRDRDDINYESESPDELPEPPEIQKNQFALDIESLTNFKVSVRQFSEAYFTHEDPDRFEAEIIDLGQPLYHNQVVKQILVVTFSQPEPKHLASRVLLDRICTQNGDSPPLASMDQTANAFRRLFFRIHDYQETFPTAYDVLCQFGEYCADKGYLDNDILLDLKAQTDFSKDPERVRQLKSKIKMLIEELFVSGDMEEAVRCVGELEAPFFGWEVVKRSISMSLDRGNRERELVSMFLSNLCTSGSASESLLNLPEASIGFEILLNRVEELYKDVPDVLKLLGFFIARAIADEVLAPKFLEAVPILQTDHGYAVVTFAKSIFRERRIYTRLDEVWGVSSSKPVSELKRAVGQIIKAYFRSEELNEAVITLKELGVPMFHHEVVKQVILYAADFIPPFVTDTSNGPVDEDHKEHTIDLAITFLSVLVDNDIMPQDQLMRGFGRVRARYSNYVLDTPHLGLYYERISARFDGIPPIVAEVESV